LAPTWRVRAYVTFPVGAKSPVGAKIRLKTNLFAEKVLAGVEHHLADLQVSRVDGSDVDDVDFSIAGEAFIAWGQCYDFNNTPFKRREGSG
jgi:hypothetical protein